MLPLECWWTHNLWLAVGCWSQAMSTPKYRLLKVEGHGKAACAFFNLPQGCRNGANCQFRHVVEEKVSAAPIDDLGMASWIRGSLIPVRRS